MAASGTSTMSVGIVLYRRVTEISGLKELLATKERDRSNYIELERLGWRTTTIWECHIKTDTENAVRPILQALQ